MLYSCTHMAAVGFKGLITLITPTVYCSTFTVYVNGYVLLVAVRLTALVEQLRYYAGSSSSMQSSYFVYLTIWVVAALFAFNQRTCELIVR